MDGLNDLMKQAQAMQEKMQSLQQEVANKEVYGESGAGLVKVRMNGKHDVLSVTLDPSILTEAKDVIEDLIAAAVNDSVKKVTANNQEMVAGLTQGMKMPDGFNMPV